MKVWVKLAIFITLFSSSATFAETLFLSGRVIKGDGRPVSGDTSFKVELCLSASCSAPVYSSMLSNVRVKNGVFQFSLSLSSSEFSTAFPGPATTTYYRITDLTNSPNSPFEAQAIAVLPYAYRIPISSDFRFDSNGQLALTNAAGGGGSGSQVIAASSSAASSALIVNGASGQTANIADFRNNSGATLFAIDPSGIAKFLGPGTSYFMGLKAATGMTANVTYTFPAAPVAGAFLQTDANGNLSWASTGGSTAASSVTGLTTGSIAFANSTGLTESNAQFFWDNTNNRLGVGTNSPATSLHVSGDARFQNIRTYGMTRTLPTTTNDYIYLGTLAFTSGGANLTVKVSASGFSASKTYFIALSDDQTSGGWKKVAPLVDSYASSDDFALDINVAATTANLRLRRTGGTTAGTAYVAMYHEGNLGDAFTASSTTGSAAAPAGYLNTSLLSMTPAGIQTYGKLYLNADPASALEAATKQYVDAAVGTLSASAISGTSTIATSGNISTTGTLGIGTTAPGSKVEIKGTGTSSAASALNVTDSAGASKFFVRNDGYVGIGTTSPSQKMEIYNGSLLLNNGVSNQTTILSEGMLGISRTTDGSYTAKVDAPTGINSARQTIRLTGREGVQLAYNTSGRLQVDTTGVLIGTGTADTSLGAASTPLHVNGTSYFNGNVGIGTTAPGTKLHVEGGNVSTGYEIARFVSNYGAYGTNGYGSFLSFYNNYSGGSTHVSSIGSLVTSANRVGLNFSTYNGSSVGEKMRLDGDGNLGIGTTSPSASLEVNGPNNAYVIINKQASTHNAGLRFNQGGTNYGSVIYDASGNFVFQGPNSTTTKVTAGNSATLELSAAASSIITLKTNGSEVMRLNSTGNVGIGTTSPAAKLDVVGTKRVTSTDNSNAYAEEYVLRRNLAQAVGSYTEIGKFTGNNGSFNIEVDLTDGQSGGGASKKFIISANYDDYNATGWSEVIPIYNSGPRGGDYTLDIGGNTINASTMTLRLRTVSILTQPSTDIHIRIRTLTTPLNAALTGTGTTTAPGSFFRRSMMTQTHNSGYVGIGITNPTAKLDVNGTIRSGASGFAITRPTDSANMSALSAPTYDNLVVGGGNQSRVTLRAHTTDVLTANTSGNVGIGTTSPTAGYRLDITGGDLRVTGSSQTCVIGAGSGANCTSDERLKENISPIKDALAKILSIRGVEFDWNDKARAPGKHQIGVIAQEVQKTFPESVEKLKGKEGYLTVDYASLVAPLIEAVREMWGYLEEILVKLDDHTTAIERLQQENMQLKSEVNELKALKSYLCTKDPEALVCK